MKILRTLILVFCLTAFVNAQKASLSGTIFDDKGAVVPQTIISLTDSKGEIHKTVTNENGVYSIKLVEGKYKIEFKKAFFSPFSIENYYVPFETKMNLDVSLEVETVVDTITVSSKNNQEEK